MIVCIVINAFLGFALAGVIAYLLSCYDETLIFVERVGIGIAGGMMVMTLADNWAHGGLPRGPLLYSWGWRLGWLCYLGGRIYRLRAHRRNNQRAKDIAGAWLRDCARPDTD